MKRGAAIAAMGIVLLLLAGCAGMPMTGQVYPGRSAEDVPSAPDIEFAPDGPQPGATPEQIVTGFMEAASAPGPQADWAIARQFLADSFAQEWNPRAGVTIDRLGDRSAAALAGEDTVVREVSPSGSVDATGAYRPEGGGATDLTYELVEDDDGQWRISQAPDGIVLYEELFRSVFQSVDLVYFDSEWEYAVPDTRWFPRGGNLAARTANALVQGEPTPWLAGAVNNAFASGIALARPVSVVDGVAAVDLDGTGDELGQTRLDRMQTQLQLAMRSAGVNAVNISLDGVPVAAGTVPLRSTRVDTQTLVETEEGAFGFLGDGDLEPVAGLSAAIQDQEAVAVEVSADLDLAAVLTASGRAVRVAADGSAAVADERAGLLAPTLDATGAVWSVPADAPSQVRVTTLDGASISVGSAWPSATGISAMRVSREGTRVVAAVSVRGRTEIWVSGIQRSTDGTAIALGEPSVLTVAGGEARDLSWLDDDSVGVLLTQGEGAVLRDQRVGGPGTDLTVPEGTDEVSGGNDSARLLSETGVVFVRQGANWQQIATDIAFVAVQRGTP
jgi:hypothetical protein